MCERKPLATLGDLKNAFILGYMNASSSLESLKKEAVCYRQFYSGPYELDQIIDFDHKLLSSGCDIVVTTEIVGDLCGKSYLLISASEFESLTREIPAAADPDVDLKVEFIKELDNILSASVITELANKLSIKAIGNVPMLAMTSSRSIGKVIYDDFRKHTDTVYLTAIYFSFDSEPSITPRFVWVVNRNDFAESSQ